MPQLGIATEIDLSPVFVYAGERDLAVASREARKAKFGAPTPIAGTIDYSEEAYRERSRAAKIERFSRHVA